MINVLSSISWQNRTSFMPPDQPESFTAITSNGAMNSSFAALMRRTRCRDDDRRYRNGKSYIK